jgi:hypothetical protein
MRAIWIGLAVATAVGVASVASAQTSRSAGPAERLAAALQERQMQHVAAADSSDPGRYVAAMVIGGGGLLVVSGRYAEPALMNERLYKSDHAGVYLALNAASDRKDRLFVQDLGAPGLHAARRPDEAFDIVYESVTQRTAFDGDWKSQKLSRDDYRRAFERLDERYAHAVEVLLTGLGAAATTDSTPR